MVRASSTLSVIAALLVWQTPARAAQAGGSPAPAAAPPVQGELGRSATRGRPTEPSPLERRVSVDLRDVPLGDALKEINRQASLGLAYSARVVPLDRRVSVRGDAISAGDALRAVLKGTGVTVSVMADGLVMLVKSPPPATPAPPADTVLIGAIAGRVTDSASTQPVAGASVRITDGALSASLVTNDSGFYLFPQLPAGAYTMHVRHIGYRPVERRVLVPANEFGRQDFALEMSLNRLQEVVSTATGQRRRLELGNDITVIDADSIVRTQPIASVTDLLEGRVPGLTVQRSSGAPGDPSRIRIRGASSAYLNNDPIVVVDGIRVYSAQSDERNRNLAALSFATPSPLDYIDPHSIATIEVLKGPSAATLYGQDAANGVIVITTKKGQVGPPRWTLSAEHGITELATPFPDLYARWGHLLSNDRRVLCPITNVTNSGPCVAGVVARYQFLNDPSTTILDQGSHTLATVGVDGGSGALTYSLTGSYKTDVGLLRLPPREAQRFSALHGAPPPDWMERPQGSTQLSATSRMVAQVGKSAEVSLSSQIARTSQQRSTLEQQLAGMANTFYDRTTGQYFSPYGVGSDGAIVGEYVTRATSAATSFRNGAQLTWRTRSWLTTSADAGLDVIQRADEGLTPRDLATDLDSVGRLNMGQVSTLTSTVNVRALARAPLPKGFGLQFAIGGNYQGQALADLSMSALGLEPGTSAIGPTSDVSGVLDRRESVATFGWYVEPSISHKRFWLSTGLRLDGGSSFGTRVTLPAFPKLSVSYLISDEPFFPLRSVFNTLRLRLAYGHAGQQPKPADRLRLYGSPTRVWGNLGGFVDGVQLARLGNTKLKPERGTEVEGGFDADMLDDRLTVGITMYRKTRTDALMERPLPPSVYGDGVTVLENIGTIRNTGVEVALTTELVRSELVRWSTGVTMSQQRSMVVGLGEGVDPFYSVLRSDGGGIRVAPGYPLFGQWERPILGYADANGNGVLERSEVLVGDTAVFVGAQEPNYVANVTSNVSLLRGALTLSATVGFQDGVTQTNAVAPQNYQFSRGQNDPTAPLAEQATYLASNQTHYGFAGAVSSMRLNNLSLTYNVPSSVAGRLRARALAVHLQGTNLALRTNYSGADPNVNSAPYGNEVVDAGALPMPRAWQLRVTARY